MKTKFLTLSLFLINLASAAHARFTLDSDVPVFSKLQRIFSPKTPKPAPELARAEFSYYELSNFNEIKKRKSGEVYYAKDAARPSVKNMLWENFEKENLREDFTSDNRLTSSQAIALEEEALDQQAEFANNVYENFLKGKASGFLRTSIILEKRPLQICNNILKISSENMILGNVFSYIYKQDRERNGYRPQYKMIPLEFKN